MRLDAGRLLVYGNYHGDLQRSSWFICCNKRKDVSSNRTQPYSETHSDGEQGTLWFQHFVWNLGRLRPYQSTFDRYRSRIHVCLTISAIVAISLSQNSSLHKT